MSKVQVKRQKSCFDITYLVSRSKVGQGHLKSAGVFPPAHIFIHLWRENGHHLEPYVQVCSNTKAEPTLGYNE